MTAEFADLGRLDGDERVAEIAGLDWPATGVGAPLVELGAGTGYVTVRLAAATEREIVAVERDPARRGALMARVMAEPALRKRITVVPGDVFAVTLPPVWGGALAFHLLCQLDDAQRQQFWKLAAAHLAPGAPLYVDRHYGMPAGHSVDEKVTMETRVGRHTYQRRFGAQPDASGATRVRNHYRVLDGDTVVYEVSREDLQWPYNEEQAIGDAAACGFGVEPVSENFLRLTTG